MRAIIQRVKCCTVKIEGKITSSIGRGMLILLGIKNGDTKADAEYLASRCVSIRIFEDNAGKMNLSLNDVNGDVMVVSQFTLYADTKKGNRPSFTDAAPPQIAETLYENFNSNLRELLGEKRIGTGIFREMMDIEMINEGPMTVIVESKINTNQIIGIKKEETTD